jgi:hypothetical protein
MEGDKEVPMQQLFTDLETAQERLLDAEAQESAARSRATDARNTVNRAQAAIDARLKALREAAPREGLGADAEARRIAALVRRDILQNLQTERDRQDEKWGGPEADDARKTPADWVADINAYTAWAQQMYRMGDIGKYRRRMLQVAALAMAACESYERQRTAAVRRAIGAQPPEDKAPRAAELGKER